MRGTLLRSEAGISSRCATKRRGAELLLACASTVLLASASCGDHEGKLAPPGSAGPSFSGEGGGFSSPGSEAGSAAAPVDAGGTAGSPEDAVGGASGAPPSEPNAGAGPIASACVYHLDAEVALGGAGGLGGAAGSSEGGVGGEGGASPTPTISKATNRLIGDYLTDDDGMSLYVFGADLPGDCQAPPVSGCVDDCLKSWPIFHAGSRVLAPGLDEAAFGSFTRADGVTQTTYYGWPLYHYANDTKAGDVTGHGSGVWSLAEVILPNVVVRRVGMDRLLADGAGRTLYAFASDTLGTPITPPESACVAECAEQHPPFSPRYVGAVSTLEPRDFSQFVRDDGTTQVAYKGAPLYYSALDERPGALNGAEDEGFTIVLK